MQHIDCHLFPLRQSVSWFEPRSGNTLIHCIVETAQGLLIKVFYSSEQPLETVIANLFERVSVDELPSCALNSNQILEDWEVVGRFPEPLRQNTLKQLTEFIDRLALPDEPPLRTFAQFNFLLTATCYRRQAIVAYPWLLDVLTDIRITLHEYQLVTSILDKVCGRPPTEKICPISTLLYVVDQGEALNPSLASLFQVRESTIRRLHGFPRTLLALTEERPEAWDITLMQTMQKVAQVVDCLNSNELPNGEREWRWFWDVLEWTRKILQGNFSALAAANIYRRLQNATSGRDVLAQLDRHIGNQMLQLLRMQLLLRSSYQKAQLRNPESASPFCRTYLADYVILWLLQHRSPRWLVRLFQTLKHKIAAAAGDSDWASDMPIPYLHFEANLGEGELLRSVSPITSASQMMRESDRMKNCLRHLIPKCLCSDRHYYFSVQDDQGLVRAHVEIAYTPENGVENCEIKGPGNEAPDSGSLSASTHYLSMIESSRPVPVRHPIEAIPMEIPKMDWEELVEQVKQDLSLEVVVEDEYTFLHSHF